MAGLDVCDFDSECKAPKPRDFISGIHRSEKNSWTSSFLQAERVNFPTQKQKLNHTYELIADTPEEDDEWFISLCAGAKGKPGEVLFAWPDPEIFFFSIKKARGEVSEADQIVELKLRLEESETLLSQLREALAKTSSELHVSLKGIAERDRTVVEHSLSHTSASS